MKAQLPLNGSPSANGRSEERAYVIKQAHNQVLDDNDVD